MCKSFKHYLVFLLIVFSACSLHSQELSSETISSGKYILLIRHGKTDHSFEDQSPLNLEDCTKQRNLSEDGKKELLAFHDRFIEKKINFEVWSSQYCRAIETAQIAFAQPKISPFLNRLNDPTAPAGHKKKFLMSLIEETPYGKLMIIVTHLDTIQSLIDIDLKEGQGAFFKVNEDKELIFVEKFN
jgi:phosphohistidine phosphatase SixA